MAEIAVFPAKVRQFTQYLGTASEPKKGVARIARLVGTDISKSMGGGVVVYEGLTVEWDLPFDELIVVLEGTMRIHSRGKSYDCRAGDVAWFPAHTPLTYEVADRATVFYALHPVDFAVAKVD
jgi:ethanolamine utilization protein EutQ